MSVGLALHMAEATAAGHRPAPPRRCRLWHVLALATLLPSGFALALVAALWILRRGL